jgi:hypothetical protein
MSFLSKILPLSVFMCMPLVAMDKYYDAKIQQRIDRHNIEIAKAEIKREKVDVNSTEYYILSKEIKQNEKDRAYSRWVLSLTSSKL